MDLFTGKATGHMVSEDVVGGPGRDLCSDQPKDVGSRGNL